jgi:hypothetical protein
MTLYWVTASQHSAAQPIASASVQPARGVAKRTYRATNAARSGQRSNRVKHSLPLLALLRHDDGLWKCPLVGVDRKRSMYRQNVAY